MKGDVASISTYDVNQTPVEDPRNIRRATDPNWLAGTPNESVACELRERVRAKWPALTAASLICCQPVE